MIKGVGKWRVSLTLKVAQNAAASFSKYYFLLSTPFLPRNIMHCHFSLERKSGLINEAFDLAQCRSRFLDSLVAVSTMEAFFFLLQKF